MNEAAVSLPLNRVGFVGAFLPRRCLTSTATTRLCQAFAVEFGSCECVALAISDGEHSHPYPSRVRFEIGQDNPDAYRAAGDFINLNDVDLVAIFYDGEIFNREAGRHLVALARSLKMPVVTIFGHVPEHSDLTSELVKLSSRVMVYEPNGAAMLRSQYGVDVEKVYAQPFSPEGFALEHLPDENHPTWREMARGIMACFQQTRQALARRLAQQISQGPSIPVTGSQAGIHLGAQDGDGYSGSRQEMIDSLPVLKLDHFLRMTDETGMLKGSILGLPDYSQGYATADNARALMFSLLLEQVGEGPFIPIEMQASRHLAFLWNAFNGERGRFRDALSYRRDWLDEEGSEDTHGLALWALGMTLGRSGHAGMMGVARRLFDLALPAVKQFSSLRAWAFSLLGIHEYLRRFAGDRAVERTGRVLLDRLVNQFRETSTPNWPWLEDALLANSASLSQALIASVNWARDPRAAEIGLKTLNWLASLQFTENGMFAPLGDPGYYPRGGQRARFTQRPVEARAMISACLEAYRYTGDERWLMNARSAFQWFLGRNDLGQPLYDAETGGCRDGLAPGRVESNYSAESLLAFLVAQLEMRLFEQLYQGRRSPNLRLPILQIGPKLDIGSSKTFSDSSTA